MSLRPRNGKVAVTDGPYAETKEQLGSYFLIEARDRDQAVEIASKHPAARLNAHLGWGVEIRQSQCAAKHGALLRIAIF